MIVFFIEDRPFSILEQMELCKQRELQIERAASVIEIDEILKDKYRNICLIVVDIMLHAVPHLEDVDIANSETDQGFEAGWVIIERLLWPKEENNEKYDCSRVPIVILSTRPLSKDIEEERLDFINTDHRHSKVMHVRYIEKNGYDNNGKECNKSFEEVLNDSIEHYKKYLAGENE